MLFGIFGAAAVEAQTLAHRDRDEVRIHPLEAGAEEAVEALENQNVALDLQEASFEEALWTIARVGQLGLSYNSDLHPKREVTLQEELSVEKALQRLLAPTKLKALISSNREVVLVKRDGAYEETVQGRSMEETIQYVDIEGKGASGTSQDRASRPLQGTITGTVTDSVSGEPLPGVNVVISGTTQGTATGPEGTFTISNVEPGTYDLQASFVGYATKTAENIEVTEGQVTEVNFALTQAAYQLGEVVAVGYGQQERGDVTASISSVNSEDLNTISTENVAEALQGQAAGVLVTQSSGEPGSGMDVMIRGASTLGSTDPLYVVDGVPLDGGLSSINTASIESVEILKDASATSIYGSRAANGVVLITTNQGTAGDIQVNFSARGGASYVPNRRRIDMMDTREFYRFSVDAYENAGLPIPDAWQEPNLSENLQQNTDWQGHLFRPGRIQDYNINISGGNEDANYSFTTGYRDEKGVVVSDGMERVSFRVNSEYYIGENGDLTIGEHLSLSQSTTTGNVYPNVFKETYQQSPTVPLRCENNIGGFCGPTNATSPGFRLNQVALLHLNETETVTQRLVGNVYADYSILEDLSYRLDLSTDLSSSMYQLFSPLYELESNANTERDLDQEKTESWSYIVENTLNYSTTVGDVHDVDVLAGYTQEKRESEYVIAEANGFPSEDLRTINASTGQTVVSGGGSGSALRSFLGRIQYGFDERYRVQFAIRRDGSSRFGSERRWGTFPSGSVGWSIHNEAFMPDDGPLSRLRLRGSWGIAGTQQIPDFAAIPTVQPVANYVLGGAVASGSAVLELGNSELQWQETRQIDIGLDAGFFDNQLTVTLDYYRKNTSNLLLQLPVPTTSGIRRDNGFFQNVGEVRNSGFELSSSYQRTFGDVSVRMSGNVSTLSNEVQSLGVEEIIATEGDELGSGSSITRPGSEIGAFYGYISEGPFRNQQAVDSHANQPGAGPGDLKFRDINDDGQITPEDRTIIGSPFPDFFYGLTANVGFKGLGLRMQMDGVQGRDIFALRSDNDVKGFNNATADYLDRWTPNNRDGAHPRAHTTDPNSNLRSSTYRVENGSYLALRNVTLDYSFDPGLVDQWVEFRNLRIYASANNLLWITPYDGYNPEIGAGEGSRASLTRSFDTGSYPISTSFEIGVDIGF
jgi:TonB-linked SusC/RagA family outer membrane protein